MSDRPYLNFVEIKARANFLDVLDRYGVQLKKVNTAQYKTDCPLPSHTNKAEHGTFGVNVEKGVFKCFSDSCRENGNGSQGNILDFVRMMSGGTPYDAAAKLDEWFPNGNQNARQQAGRNGQCAGTVPNNPKTATPEVNRPLAFQLKDVNPHHEMIQTRGISEETAKKFGVGYFGGKGSMANRIVFELHENGSLVGYAGRAVNGEDPRWKLPAGLKKSFVYGLEHCDPHRPLILGESFWLPLFVHEKGGQAASLMGTEMTPEQEACLAPFKFIHLAFDNDDAGIEKSRPIAERLRKTHTVRVCRLME